MHVLIRGHCLLMNHLPLDTGLVQWMCFGTCFKDITEAEYVRTLGFWTIPKSIYNLCHIRYSAVQEVSKKKPWPTILCLIPVFCLSLKHLFSFDKLLVRKTDLKRMRVLLTSHTGFSCTSCDALLGYNRLVSAVPENCVAQLPQE